MKLFKPNQSLKISNHAFVEKEDDKHKKRTAMATAVPP